MAAVAGMGELSPIPARRLFSFVLVEDPLIVLHKLPLILPVLNWHSDCTNVCHVY